MLANPHQQRIQHLLPTFNLPSFLILVHCFCGNSYFSLVKIEGGKRNNSKDFALVSNTKRTLITTFSASNGVVVALGDQAAKAKMHYYSSLLLAGIKGRIRNYCLPLFPSEFSRFPSSTSVPFPDKADLMVISGGSLGRRLEGAFRSCLPCCAGRVKHLFIPNALCS